MELGGGNIKLLRHSTKQIGVSAGRLTFAWARATGTHLSCWSGATRRNRRPIGTSRNAVSEKRAAIGPWTAIVSSR